MRVAFLLELVGADLPKQPEELAAERALRVRAVGNSTTCRPGNCSTRSSR
jgi:hypothetical protein